MTPAAVALTDQEARVLDLIDEDGLVGLALRLVAHDSTNPGGTEAGTVAELEQACAAAGMRVATQEVAPGRPNLVATLGDAHGTGEGLLFLGHSDVVPAGPGWSRDPFDPVVAGGRLIGRGAADMKGGLAAIVAAVDAVRRSGRPLSGPVSLACTVDEEDLDTGIRHLVADPGFLPGRYRGCVVAEPTSLQAIVACRGDAYLEIEVTGIPAHSGRPADGRNAIDAAARIIALLRADQERLDGEPDPALGSGSWNVGRIAGGRGTSIVAPDAHLWVDRRLLPGEDPERVAAQVRRAVEGSGITGDGIEVALSVTMEMPGFSTDPEHPLVGGAVQSARALGRTCEVGVWTAACDGGFVVRDLGIPTIVLGPGDINEQAHQVDESVAVADLVAAARLYALLAVRMLANSTGRT